MSSTYGEKIKISVFGESHGNGIGVVIDGLSAGAEIDMDGVLAQMKRRAPGRDKTATPRKESDLPEVLSGMLGSTLTGAPLCAVIRNTNTKSGDYSNLLECPRPGHSDYTAFIKYGGANDIRGGGHFSGRITAPLVFAGSICRQLLEKRGIKIAAHIKSIGGVNDKAFDPTKISEEQEDIARRQGNRVDQITCRSRNLSKRRLPSTRFVRQSRRVNIRIEMTAEETFLGHKLLKNLAVRLLSVP